MKKIYITLAALLCLSANSIQAQDSNDKLDAVLGSIIAKNAAQVSSSKLMGMGTATPAEALDTTEIKNTISVAFDSDGNITTVDVVATLAEGATCPAAELEAMGISVEGVLGDIVTLKVPVDKVSTLATMPAFAYVSGSYMAKTMNEGMRKSIMADMVTGETASDIPAPYTGKGVIVGIIDSGIDFQSAAFRNPETGKTRIVRAISGTTEYTTEDQINTLSPKITNSSHGTHTSGIAAGSKVGDLNLQGIAPDAELFLCDLGSSLSDNNIINALTKIATYAASVGKPCVINLSIGINVSFIDGTNNVAKAIANLTEKGTKKGLVVCVSAGNAAKGVTNVKKVLGEPGGDGYNLRTLSIGNAATYNNQTVLAYPDGVSIIATANDDKAFSIAVKVANTATGALYDLTEKSLYTTSGSRVSSLSITNSKGANGRAYATVTKSNTALLFHEPDLALAFLIKGAAGQTILMSDNNSDVQKGYYGERDYPALVGFENGCRDYSVNCFACTEGCISVGAYNDRSSFTGFTGTAYKTHSYASYPKGYVSIYSSYGIDDNNIAHPDVVAPGTFISSASNMKNTSLFNSDMTMRSTNDAGRTIDYSITNYISNVTIGDYSRPMAYEQELGTSQAAPCVTGTVALWLEAKGDLSVKDVRDIITETSVKDEYTTNPALLPYENLVQGGNGKINALEGIYKIIGKPTDAVAIDVDEKTAATDHNTYNALGQRVAASAKGLVIRAGKAFFNN